MTNSSAFLSACACVPHLSLEVSVTVYTTQYIKTQLPMGDYGSVGKAGFPVTEGLAVEILPPF